jgi:hypothetical protein
MIIILVFCIMLMPLLISCSRAGIANPAPSHESLHTPGVTSGSGLLPDIKKPDIKKPAKNTGTARPSEGLNESEEKENPGHEGSYPDQQPEKQPKPSSVPTASALPKPENTPKPDPDTNVPVQSLKGIVNPYVPYTYDQMMNEAKELEEKYKDILTTGSIGKSVEGRELLLIKLGKGEKRILLCGAHHAREYISSSYLMKMAEEYAAACTDSGKYGNYNVKDILDKVTLYMVPMVNPDGVNLVNQGIAAVSNQEAIAAMKMVNPSYREWKANINGVDLNRQYPAYWDEKYDNVGVPASENFKGTAPATEPEVKAMMRLTEETGFELAASFHTKGNAVYWADSGTAHLILQAKGIADRLSSLTGYDLMPVSKDPSVYGAGYENWFRQEFKRPAFCIELTEYNNKDLPHDDRYFDSLVWERAKYIGLFLANEAM